MNNKIKNIMIGIFVLVMSFAMIPTVSAEENNIAIFSIDEVKPFVGDQFSATLYLSENSDVTDFQTQYKYNTDIVSLVSATADTNLSGNLMITTDTLGILNVTYTRTSGNLTDVTPLVDLVFQVDASAGDGTYDLLILDDSYDNIAHTSINYELFETDFTTDFSPLNICPVGDVNTDGQVRINDATYLRLHLVQLRLLDSYELLFADAYSDNLVDIFDAVRIQQKLAKDDLLLGNRVTISFINNDGTDYVKKSVVFDNDLTSIPLVPYIEGYSNGRWSYSANEYQEVDFTSLVEDITVYAIYDRDSSPAMSYYKNLLTQLYYSDTTLSGNLALDDNLVYQDGYTARVYWQSTDNSLLNSTTGIYTQPTYDDNVSLAATIVSYIGDSIDSQEVITFDYVATGYSQVPSTEEVENYLKNIIGDNIDCDFTLPRSITEMHIPKSSPYEIRLEWVINDDGVEIPISEIERSTSATTLNIVAIATFEGQPVTGDGKIYFDSTQLSAITESEIKSYIVSEIAANMGQTLTDGVEFWNDDEEFNALVTWTSNNQDIATISNNVVDVSDSATNGLSLPLTAQVTYRVNEGTPEEDTETFDLGYTMSVVTDNALLVPGVNIDQELFDALKTETGTFGNMTTDHLKDRELVYLDLSDYPDITNLKGLTYCTNLRVLNISGLKITDNINEIGTLYKLEALIAKDCGLDNLSDGGVPVLKTMINLKLLDLSNNEFTNLDSVFDENTRYNQLSSVYFNSNKITDISNLSVAPAVTLLSLANNELESDDLETISGFEFIQYLSIAHNEIDDLTELNGLRYMLELRAHDNQIDSVAPLQHMSSLTKLFLGYNDLYFEADLAYLNNLTELKVLYLNDNDLDSIDILNNLDELVAINVTNNDIQSLSVLKNYTDLQEIYAENNDIASFSFVKNLSKLERLTLANNGTQYEKKINEYLSGLTEMKSLTLSGKPLYSLQFLDNMNNIGHLEVENCSLGMLWPIEVTYSDNDSDNEYTMNINSYYDNIDYIYQKSETIAFLNISNNDFRSYLGIENREDLDNWLNQDQNWAPFADAGYSIDEFSLSSISKNPSFLKEMTDLEIFYADNLGYDIDDPSEFFGLMSNLKLMSFENCGINDASFLSKYSKLAYVDLAGNNIASADIGNYISERSTETLMFLYLDHNVKGNFRDSYSNFSDNKLIDLSLENVVVESLEDLPDMDNLKYLNLSGTEIAVLGNDSSKLAPLADLSRYSELEVIDVSGMDVSIPYILDEFENGDEDDGLTMLDTIYAVGTVNDPIFYKDNLRALYDLDSEGITGYLYDYDYIYNPDENQEGNLILAELPDLEREIIIAADNVISDNNPVLTETINDFDIIWTVSNDTNYEISNNQISVSDYANIDDEELILTATMIVYPDRPAVSRTYTIDTHVLRVDEGDYIDTNDADMENTHERNQSFTHQYDVVGNDTDGFSTKVKPVYDDINYISSAVDGTGNSIPYINVMDIPDEMLEILSLENIDIEIIDIVDIETEVTTGAAIIVEDIDLTTASAINIEIDEVLLDNNVLGEITVQSMAPLDAVFTIRTEIVHYIDGTPEIDWEREDDTKIVATQRKVTFIKNGGSVLEDGDVIDNEPCEIAYSDEQTLPFGTDVTFERLGYTFDGLYSDDSFNTPFTETQMPNSNLTVYLKWTLNSFTARFNPGEGSTPTAEMLVNCDTPIGTLPVPTRDYYTFEGWYTQETGGDEVTDASVFYTTDDTTLYAHWTINALSEWVESSSVPTGGSVEEQKWKYTYTDIIESSDTAFSGYSRTGNEYWQNEGTNSFQYADFEYKPSTHVSSFVVDFPTSNSLYIKYNKSPYTSYENTTSKRDVSSPSRTSWIYWHWMYGCGGSNAYDRAIHYANEYWTPWSTTYSYWNFGAFETTTNHTESSSHGNTIYTNKSTHQSYSDSQGSWYWYRLPIYTSTYTDYIRIFEYIMIEDRESSTVISPSDDNTNVVEWVKFRPQ